MIIIIFYFSFLEMTRTKKSKSKKRCNSTKSERSNEFSGFIMVPVIPISELNEKLKAGPKQTSPGELHMIARTYAIIASNLCSEYNHISDNKKEELGQLALAASGLYNGLIQSKYPFTPDELVYIKLVDDTVKQYISWKDKNKK
jgi:hypothetical protein